MTRMTHGGAVNPVQMTSPEQRERAQPLRHSRIGTTQSKVGAVTDMFRQHGDAFREFLDTL